MQIQCTKCLEYKDQGKFSPRYEGNTGRSSWCRECNNASSTEWRENNPDRVKANKRSQYLKRRDIKTRVVAERCEICGLKFIVKSQNGNKHPASPHWDHNHGTEVFRGWLCHNHNAMLGHAGDNPMILEKAAQYLRDRGYTITQTIIS